LYSALLYPDAQTQEKPPLFIQTGPDEFWFSPVPVTWNDRYGLGIPRATLSFNANAQAGTSYATQNPDPPLGNSVDIIIGNSDTLRKEIRAEAVHDVKFIKSDLIPVYTDVHPQKFGGLFPFKIVLATGTLTGNCFGNASAAEDTSLQTGVTDTDVTDFLEDFPALMPTVVITAKKWFAHEDQNGNARWDENTGARL